MDPGIDEINGVKAKLANWNGLDVDGLIEILVSVSSRLSHQFVIDRPVVDQIVESYWWVLSRPRLSISRNKFLSLLRFHPFLTNLVHISSYGNFDEFGLKGSRVKSLSALLFINLRSNIEFDRSVYFEIEPNIASEWYGQYIFGARSFIDKGVYQNLTEHLRFWHPAMAPRSVVSNGYMRSSYLDPGLDRLWKTNFNNLVKSSLKSSQLKSSRRQVNELKRKPRVLVATGRWSPKNPTYKNRFDFFQSLKGDTELDLLHLGPKRTDLETSIFKHILRLDMASGPLNISDVLNGAYDCIFYPDIGMNVESRFLSNLRLAPYQITTNSHPVSTFGSEIDFFITGLGAELAPHLAKYHYLEKLILIPGIGTQPNIPNYHPRGNLKRSDESSAILVGCPWGCLKINYELISRLKEISDATHNVRFRFLITCGPESVNRYSIKKDLERHLGASNIDLHFDLPYEAYMEKLEACDFALDAFPFAGNTSIVDSMYLSLPIVSQAGWSFYNLAGPYILRQFGVEDCCVTSRSQYIDRAIKLAKDLEYRKRLIDAIKANEFAKVLATLGSTAAFKSAILAMLEGQYDHHDGPIIVSS